MVHPDNVAFGSLATVRTRHQEHCRIIHAALDRFARGGSSDAGLGSAHGRVVHFGGQVAEGVIEEVVPMHDPERGRTQVPIVCSIVLLLVAVVFAWNEHEARVAVEKDLNEILAAAGDASSPSRTPKAAAIHYITQARGVYARQRERLEQILEVTGGADETDPELFVDPARLKVVQTRFLKAIDSGEFTIEFPMEDGTKSMVRYGLTKDLRGLPPNLSNIVEFVVIPAMRRMFSDIQRYRALCSEALGEKEAARLSHKSALAAKEAAVRALTAERDDWRKKAEQASAELEALKQR